MKQLSAIEHCLSSSASATRNVQKEIADVYHYFNKNQLFDENGEIIGPMLYGNRNSIYLKKNVGRPKVGSAREQHAKLRKIKKRGKYKKRKPKPEGKLATPHRKDAPLLKKAIKKLPKVIVKQKKRRSYPRMSASPAWIEEANRKKLEQKAGRTSRFKRTQNVSIF